MNKRFILILLAIVVVFFGVIVVTRKKSDAPGATSASVSNHTVGEGKKQVTLTEYGDFECQYCASYHPTLQQVKQKYGQDITFKFRHFPLTQIHKHAMEASRAAEAAGLQGKFWEMHNMLYEQQRSWVSASSVTQLFEMYAKQLNLNIEKFKQDVSSPQVAATIDADLKAGQSAGVNSTPTFLINDKKQEIKNSVEDFSKAIDEAMANSSD